MSTPVNTHQTFFFANTHASPSHLRHDPPHSYVATEWKLGIRDENRASGYREYSNLGHVNFSGQSTLDMFSNGGSMLLPEDLRKK